VVGVVVAIVALTGGIQLSGLGGGLDTLFKVEDKNDSPLPSARFAPLAWSPVRRELAFGGAAGGAESVLPQGWLLPAASTAASASTNPSDPVRRAIWVLPPGEGHADLIAVTTGQFSAPCWAPDGESLYFVRWEPAADGGGSLALIRRRRDGTTDVIHQEAGRYPFSERQSLPFETPAASPDGLFVVAPWLNPKGLVVVNLETNQVVRKLAAATGPSWSPDSQQLAYFVSEPATPIGGLASGPQRAQQRNAARLKIAERKALLASGDGRVARSMGEFDATQPARWDQTGHTLLALRSLVESPSSFEPSRVQLFRVTVGEGRAARLLGVSSAEEKAKPPASSFAFDAKTDTLFLCAPRPDARMLVERYDLSGAHSESSFHPFEEIDSPLPPPLGAVSLSKDGKRLAFRFGKPDAGAPVAVWDIDAERATTIHTDDAGDLRAAAVFVASARRSYLRVHPENGTAYQMTLPGSWDRGREHPQRLAAFPRRGRLALTDDVRLLSVRRLAADGLAFIAGRRNSWATNRTKADASFDELALQLYYFREEFERARRCVDRLTLDQPMPDERRVMLAILRAQCLEATAGPGLARFSLEPIIEAGLLKKLRAGESDGAPHPFVKRIEELYGSPALGERSGDDEP